MRNTFYFLILTLFVAFQATSQTLIPENFKKFETGNDSYLLPSKKGSDFKSVGFKSENKLDKGEVISFQLQLLKKTETLKEARGCTGGAGFKINDINFFIENTKKDLRIYVGKGEITKIPMYIIDRFTENISLSLQVKNNENTFEWVITSPKHTIGNTIENTSKKATIEFAFRPTSGKEIKYLVSQLHIDNSTLPTYKEAELHPFYKYESTTSNKKDWEDPAAKSLVLDQSTSKLTQEELKGLESYLLNFELPKHNHFNYYFRKRFNSYAIEWMFEKTNNIELLNKSIEFANRAITYRNDNYGLYKISFDRTAAPIWPNYKEVEVYNDGTTGLVPGASLYAGLATITVPARIIANNPELWNKKYGTKTYKEIAEEFIAEALKTTDYVYDVFVGEDNLIRYPELLFRKEWHNKVFIYNRVFPVITGSIPLVDAMDTFKLHTAKKNKINTVNQAMVDHLKSDITFYTDNGNECMKYPYSEAMKISKPLNSEDFTHGAFDSRDFQLLYVSNRYDFNERYVNAMANTLADVMPQGEDGFSSYIDGRGKAKKFKTPIAFNGYIWYCTYRPELKEIIIDYVLDNNIVHSNNRYDSYFIYEVLKLKDKGAY